MGAINSIVGMCVDEFHKFSVEITDRLVKDAPTNNIDAMIPNGYGSWFDICMMSGHSDSCLFSSAKRWPVFNCISCYFTPPPPPPPPRPADRPIPIVVRADPSTLCNSPHTLTSYVCTPLVNSCTITNEPQIQMPKLITIAQGMMSAAVNDMYRVRKKILLSLYFCVIDATNDHCNTGDHCIWSHWWAIGMDQIRINYESIYRADGVRTVVSLIILLETTNEGGQTFCGKKNMHRDAVDG